MIILLGILIVFASNKGDSVPEYQTKTITIADYQIQAYIADTENKRERGLAAFERIQSNQGMIFYFDQTDKYPFWMKDMRFAIDIIWIQNNTIVDIASNVTPEPDVPDNKLTKYVPTVEADRVLEVNAGWADKYGIKIGDEVDAE